MKFATKLILSLLVTIWLTNCTSKKARITINAVNELSGFDRQNILLLNQYGDSLYLDTTKSPNTFGIAVADLETGYHTLILGENQIHLYLTPSTDLQINLGLDTLIFSGEGAEPNNYLKRKYSSEFDWYSNYYKTKQTGNMITYFRDHYINKLKQEVKQLTPHSQFIQAEQKELNYKYFNQLLIDKILLETNPDTHEAIIKDLEKAVSVKIDDAHALNSSKNFISVVARILVLQNRVDDLSSYYNKINHPNFKTHFLESLASALHKELQFAEDDFNKAKTVEAFITKKQPLDSIGHHIFNLYDKFHEAEGQLARFSYENINGEIVSLENLRGKYVYVDFWATWCTNCIKEFPYLKKLESQFEGKAIAFIGISVDKLDAKEKWKKMVVQKELENIQLIAPFQGHPDRDDIDDEFINLLYVNAYYLGIPHYALIDPTGKIIDAFFYRPSNPKTATYISKLFMD